MTVSNAIQRIGRGIRNKELTVFMANNPTVLSYVTDGILPEFKSGYQRNFTHDHWCYNSNTDRWTFHKGRPYHEYVVGSDRILARREDGTFYWYKRRDISTPCEIDEAELKSLLFVILGAEEVKKTRWQPTWVTEIDASTIK